MNLKGKFVLGIVGVTTTLLIGSSVFAAEFTDIKSDFWAYDTIKQMSDKNIILGYSDGTFKPNQPVSKVEVLVVLARILGVSSEENKALADSAEQNYSGILQDYDTYAKREVSFLLEKGILTEKDLATYLANGNDEKSMERYEVVPLIVRIMGQEEEVAKRSLVVLDYKDAELIPEELRGDVQYLGEVGLMGTATDDNQFMPDGLITRAQIATLASRIMDKLAAGTNSTVNEGTNTQTGDTANTTTNDQTNQDENVAKPDVKGIVKEVKTDYVLGRKIISVTTSTADGDKTSDIYVEPTAEIIVNGQPAHVTKIQKDYLAKVYLNSDGKATKIIADQKERTFEGIIENIDILNKILTVKEDTQSVTYHIDDDVVIEKNGQASTLSNITKGNKASLNVVYEDLKSVTLISETSQLEGVIQEVIIAKNPRITIKKSDGTIKTCDVNSNASIKINDDVAQFYDLRPDFRVNMQFDSSEAIVIDAMQQVEGTISSLDLDYREIVITPNDKIFGNTVQVLISDNTKYINGKTGEELTELGIEANKKVIAIGKLVKNTMYVKKIIIE